MTNIKSLLLLLLLTASSTLLAAPVISVYKSPTCGCCNDWVNHLKDNGFEVNTYDSNNMGDIKQRLGVTPQLASCHTAMVDGYVLEGHVPAKDIKRLLEQRPKVTGLTVPGMPMGSPGMEGHRVDKYDVLTFDKAKNTEVFSRY